MTDWLLKTLLATSVLTLLVLAVREPVRRYFGSRVAYALWLIPVARLFMPTLTRTVERAVPAAMPLQPLTDPLVRESLWMARVTPPEPSLIDRVGGWPNLLIALWLCVAAGLFLSRLVAYARDRHAILASAEQIGRVGSVRILSSPEVASPIALGILDRLIAVPADFDRLYGARERRLVLEHELAHHRSGDLVANLFALAVLCLQWFNPLAWVAHAAFRFDQEAACDARVLDKTGGADRADYGRAIAKAASGRALLFASALDRRNTLQRRLQSMLRISNPGRRLAGRVLVMSAIAAALPLTASRAVDYVNAPSAPRPVAAPHATPAVAPLASAPVAAAQPVPSAKAAAVVPVSAAVATAAPSARNPRSNFRLTTDAGKRLSFVATPVASTYTVASADGQHFILNGDSPRQFEIRDNGQIFVIDGKKKRWEDLTPAERDQVRRAVAKANEALAKTHIDQAKIAEDLARIPDATKMAELQRQLGETQARISESVRRMQAEEARARAADRNPDQLEAAIRATMQSVQAVDLSAASRALATVDRQKIAADVANAQTSIEAARAELARLQARIEADEHR